jgi:hypothetical protein
MAEYIETNLPHPQTNTLISSLILDMEHMQTNRRRVIRICENRINTRYMYKCSISLAKLEEHIIWFY